MSAILLFCFLILAPDPFAAPDGLEQAIKLYQHGHFHRAVILLTESSQSSPDDPDIRFWLGKSLLKIRKWDDAIRELEKAVELQPNCSIYSLWLGRAYGGKASHSSFLTALGWARKVVKAFERARELAPDNLDVRFDLLDFYLNAPGVVGGGRDKAEAEAAEIAKLDPGEGCVARAAIFEKDKNWNQARLELVQAMSLFPGRVNFFVDLADLLLRRQQFEDSAAQVEKALSIDANKPKAKLILAAAQIRLGKDITNAEYALSSLSQAPLSDDDPSFEEVFYWLGQAYLAEGKTPEAKEAFNTSLHYNPDYDKVKNALAQIK